MKRKTIIDIIMTALLPLLMAYSLVGESLHEWLGAAMFLLVILHHVLNRRWFSGLKKGPYGAVRTFNTVLDLALLLDMLLQFVSALLISRHVFVFLGISGGASLGRILHMLGAFWGFVLMSLHLGVHVRTVASRLGILNRRKLCLTLGAFFGAVSVYGIVAFIKRRLAAYLFLRQTYVFLDANEPLILYLLDYLAIMILLATASHFLGKALGILDKNRQEKAGSRGQETAEEAAESRQRKRRKRRIILTTLGALLLGAALVWGIPYVRRHFVTVRIRREQATAMEGVDLGKTLVIHFTRNGNSDFKADVDATSSASLMLDETGALVGNAELLAEMVQNATGGDLYPIRVATESRYPSSYGGTISLAGDEFDGKITPRLDPSRPLPRVEEYDTIIVIIPIWWWKVPKAVELFLTQLDWTGKEVHLVVTHGGSGAGNCPRDMASMLQGGQLSDNVLTVYDDDVDEAAGQVQEWLKSLK